MPKKFLSLIFFTCLVSSLFLSLVPKASSDELDDIKKQISDLTSALSQSVAATKPLESQLTSMQLQISGIKTRVLGVEQDIELKKKEIDSGYKTLTERQIVLNQKVRDYYIKSYSNSPLLIFLSSQNASELTQNLAYQHMVADRDKTTIINLALSITDLEQKKKDLLDEQQRLLIVKASLDEQSAKLDQVVKGAKNYQSQISGQIAALSAKQQDILNARSGSFTATIGDSDLADDYNASIKGFRESAPSGSFAVFSFGAYTHRMGMSQYGAFGRAQAGKSYQDILQAYYNKQPVSKDTGGTIKVAGFGDIDFETKYLYGIAEMPSSFPKEALRAQAVAARTYAYRFKTQGQEICTNEACQVYSSSKADNPPDAWKQAVNDTKGQVIEDVVTYYSSTTGGYVSPLGWDTTDGQGGSSFSDRAYEKLAGSPWFYKAWWRKGYSGSGDTCGRSSPWLSGSDLADLVNAAVVLYNGGSSDETNRITPPTTACWGGNPYSPDDLKQVSSKYGGGINTITDVSVSQGNGTTSEVVFQTDKGEKRFSGSNFKQAFNLRAPGYLSIPQNGFAFFNIEKK